MPFQIKNWKLAILGLLGIGLFLSLGKWQLSRAAEKESMLQTFNQRIEAPPLQTSDLSPKNDLRYHRATLSGEFDNAHTFLLDNKIFQGKIGYEVYTPFRVKEGKLTILVNRGFIPMGHSRQQLPYIAPILGETTINGMLASPPGYVSFGKMQDSPDLNWPLRIEYIQLQPLSDLIQTPLFSYVLQLAPKQKEAFAVEWQIVNMTPIRHIGYAVQWFALAITLLILLVALNLKWHFKPS